MILVAGSANLDFVVRVPRLPVPGETVLGGNYALLPGGKGANQAVAAARAGGHVAFVGAVGRDSFAGVLEEALEASGADVSRLRHLDAPTGAAFISVSEDGENVITVASGANALVVPDGTEDWTGVTTLLMQLEIPVETVMAFAKAARASGARVVLNAAPARAVPDDLLRDVNVLIVNEGELRMLTGDSDGEPVNLAGRLRERGPEIVVVTLGARGCFAAEAESVTHLVAFPVEAVDTVGAGDTFAGVLSVWLDEGRDLGEALRAATVAAALACTTEGAQTAMPTRAEIERHL